jgi:hypothetical protein
MKDRKSVPANLRVLYTEEPVPSKQPTPAWIVDLKITLDGERLQCHSHTLTSALMERLTENDKDLIANHAQTPSGRSV